MDQQPNTTLPEINILNQDDWDFLSKPAVKKEENKGKEEEEEQALPLPQPQPQPQSQSQPQPQQEHQEPIPQLLPVPTPSRSTPSLSGVNAIDGRASSKRMVEEYLTSKKTPSTEDNNKKFKYKSDFTSLMEEAMKNNSNSDVATEDKPLLYYAKFDFSAREHGELGYEKADPIIVIDSSDDIWWTGYKVDSELFYVNIL